MWSHNGRSQNLHTNAAFLLNFSVTSKKTLTAILSTFADLCCILCRARSCWSFKLSPLSNLRQLGCQSDLTGTTRKRLFSSFTATHLESEVSSQQCDCVYSAIRLTDCGISESQAPTALTLDRWVHSAGPLVQFVPPTPPCTLYQYIGKCTSSSIFRLRASRSIIA